MGELQVLQKTKSIDFFYQGVVKYFSGSSGDVQLENTWVGMAKKDEVASSFKGGSLIGLNFIFSPIDHRRRRLFARRAPSHYSNHSSSHAAMQPLMTND